jgi:hypothetical protein
VRSVDHCCSGKVFSITLPVCVCVFVALGIRHAMRACAILSSVACPALQYFVTVSHKRHDFRKKKKLSNVKCVFRVSVRILSETFFILRRNERDMIEKVYYYNFILLRF